MIQGILGDLITPKHHKYPLKKHIFCRISHRGYPLGSGYIKNYPGILASVCWNISISKKWQLKTGGKQTRTKDHHCKYDQVKDQLHKMVGQKMLGPFQQTFIWEGTRWDFTS